MAASLAHAAGRLWRAISPRDGADESACGDANPAFAAAAAATAAAMPSLCTNPSNAQREGNGKAGGEDELSSEATLPLPYTPPRTVDLDPLFRRETPPAALPSFIALEAAVKRTSTCTRRLALSADVPPNEDQQGAGGRPRKIPFIVCMPDGALRISPAAAQELASREESVNGVRVLSIFGGPRTGKSTLVERGFFGLEPEPEDPDHVPAATQQENAAVSVATSVDEGPSPGKRPLKVRADPSDSPASSRSVIVWLWNQPVRTRQTITSNPDRFGGRGSSVASNVSVSSFSSGRVASCGAMGAVPWSPCEYPKRAATDTEFSDAITDELVEITVLESGSCATIDESIVLALCILLSSQVVYNGMDLLDAARIQKLTALRDLTKNINTREDSGLEDGVAFREHFPRLSWLLRDCDAQLIDERRHPISPSAYLERALKVRGFSEEAEEKNMVRKMIASFFPEQDCHVLPTPAAIPGLPLGERFLRKLEVVRDAILAGIPVKTVMGRRVDGAMLHDLAQAYVADVNAAQPLCIPKACDSMSVSRCELALQRALEKYHAELQVLQASLPTSDAAILQWHWHVSALAHKVLDAKAVTDVEQLHAQLDAALLQLQKEVVRENDEASRVEATRLLEDLYADCEQRLRSGEITSLEQYEVERERVRRAFESSTGNLAQYACRTTMLEFMERRLMRFSQLLLNTAARQQHAGAAPISSPTRLPRVQGSPVLTRTPRTSTGAPLPSSPRLPSAFSSDSTPGAAEGKWVKREVLEHVKRKAKADLVELENELLTVIMAMEDQAKDEANQNGGDPEALAGPSESALLEEHLPDDSSVAPREEEPAEEIGPVIIAKTRQRLQRAAPPPPAVCPRAVGLSEAGTLPLADASVECKTPLSFLHATELGDGGADSQEASVVLPVALEAALDAAVEESDGPWAAAVAAAMMAAQDEDGEAWHVALEAALEVATAQAASSSASLFRERVLAASRRSSQSPAPEHLSAVLAVPQQRSALRNDAVQESPHARLSPSNNSENVAPPDAICESSPKTVAKCAVAVEELCRTGPKPAPLSANDINVSLDKVVALGKPDGQGDEVAASAQQAEWPRMANSTWVMGINGCSVKPSSAGADEAACRSVEAEIIRRCISDTTPIEFRRTPRTPTVEDFTLPAGRTCNEVALGARNVPQAEEAAATESQSSQQTVLTTKQASTRAQRTAAPPQEPPCRPSRQQAAQPPDSHTYTASHLGDLAVRTIRSPSESESHQPLSWQISSPAPRTNHPGCGAVATSARISFVNTPPASPLKAPVATPSPRKSTLAAAPERRPGASTRAAPANWLTLPSRSAGDSAFEAAGGGGMTAAPGASVIGAGCAPRPEGAKSPVSAASPSPLAATAPNPPVVSYRGVLPPQQKRQLQLAAQALEMPSPRVPSLLPGLGPPLAPIMNRPVEQPCRSAAPPATILLQAAAAPPQPQPQQGLGSKDVVTEGHMQAELAGVHAAVPVPPLQGQLFLDGVELIVPDPALGLLNCACLRKVSVRPPTPDGDAGCQGFVDVCIDCGTVHPQL